MAARYVVFRQLEDGEFIRVIACDDLFQAQQILRALSEYWPSGYLIWGPYPDFDSAGATEKTEP